MITALPWSAIPWEETMTKRIRLRRALAPAAAIAVAAAATVFGLQSASAVGGGQFTGKFENLCSYTHTNADDAILFPNQPGASAHMHDYVSNPGANANSTAQSLRAGSTNCVNNLDFASYWAPTLYNGTTPVHTASDTIYYLTNGKRNVKPYPFGFKEIAGNAKAMNTSQARDILWGCSTTAPTLMAAPNCAAGEQLHVRVDFADCWDGVHLDSPDHVSHVAYSDKGVCPSGFPVPIPMLSILFKYPTNNGSALKTSAGMGTYSMHADFFNAWDVNELQHLVTMCLDAGKDCGRPTGVQ
jgi:hypothetical protein